MSDGFNGGSVPHTVDMGNRQKSSFAAKTLVISITTFQPELCNSILVRIILKTKSRNKEGTLLYHLLKKLKLFINISKDFRFFQKKVIFLRLLIFVIIFLQHSSF